MCANLGCYVRVISNQRASKNSSASSKRGNEELLQFRIQLDHTTRMQIPLLFLVLFQSSLRVQQLPGISRRNLQEGYYSRGLLRKSLSQRIEIPAKIAIAIKQFREFEKIACYMLSHRLLPFVSQFSSSCDSQFVHLKFKVVLMNLQMNLQMSR